MSSYSFHLFDNWRGKSIYIYIHARIHTYREEERGREGERGEEGEEEEREERRERKGMNGINERMND